MTTALATAAAGGNPPSQDFNQTLAYINALTSGNAATSIVDWRACHDANKAIPAIPFRDTLHNAWPSILHYQSQGYGIFTCINELDGNGLTLSNVKSIRFQAVDLDNTVTAPMSLDRASKWFPKPSFGVETSPGKYHVYWPVSSYADNDRYSVIQRKLRQFFDGDKGVIDATRILRVPGTLHLKQPQTPHLVTCFAMDGYGNVTPPELFEAALANVNVIDGGSGGRRELGDPDLAAPSLEWLKFGLSLIDPNDLDRSEWISTTAAMKQSGWSLVSHEQELFDIWSEWCARYKTNDPGDNRKQWNSIRATEVGWNSLVRRAPALHAHLMFDGRQTPQGALPGSTKLLIPVRDLLQQPRVRNWLVRDILPANAAGVLYGAPGTGKTFVAIEAACCVATGTAFNGNKVSTGPVVYVAGEGHVAIRDRFDAWFKDRKADTGQENIHVTRVSVSFVDRSQFEMLVNEIETMPTKPKLVIVDTLFRATAGADVNDAQAMSAFWGCVESIKARFGCTVLLVHHVGRNEQGRSFGSIVLLANADFEISVNGNVIENTKQKDAKEFEPIHYKLKQIYIGPHIDNDTGDIENLTSCVCEFVEAKDSSKQDIETHRRINENVPLGPKAETQRKVGGLLCAIYDQVLKHRGIAKSDTIHSNIAIPKELLQNLGDINKDDLRNGLNGLGTIRKHKPYGPWIVATGDKKYVPKLELLKWARDAYYENFDNVTLSDAELALIA